MVLKSVRLKDKTLFLKFICSLLGELSSAVRAQNLTFGLYHSLFEWYNKMYDSDRGSGFTKAEFVDRKVIPEMQELVEAYQPNILWSDGDWEAPDHYWKSTMFLAWLYNESPVKDVVVTNDRWGSGTACKHGGFYTCQDRYNPGTFRKLLLRNLTEMFLIT